MAKKFIIPQVAAELTDEEFFRSPQIVKKLRSFLGLIAAQNGISVSLRLIESGDAIAYTDSRCIYANPENEFSRGKSRAYKWLILLGLLAHEMGHCLWTNFKEFNVFVKHFQNEGELFPKVKVSPELEARKAEIKAAWSSNAGIMLSVFSQMDNINEDGFLENAFCKIYRGLLKKGLNAVRYEHWKSCEPIDEDCDELSALMQIWLEYVKFGQIKQGVLEDSSEVMKTFKELKPVLDEMLRNDGDRRVQLIQCILISWPILKQTLQDRERMIQMMQQMAQNGLAVQISGQTQQGSGNNSSVQMSSQDKQAAGIGSGNSADDGEQQKNNKTGGGSRSSPKSSKPKNSDNSSGSGDGDESTKKKEKNGSSSKDGNEDSSKKDDSGNSSEKSEKKGSKKEDRTSDEKGEGDKESSGQKKGNSPSGESATSENVSMDDPGEMTEEDRLAYRAGLESELVEGDDDGKFFEKVEAPELDDDVDEGLDELSVEIQREIADNAYEAALEAELSKLNDSIDYGDAHHGYPLYVRRIETPSQEQIDAYTQTILPLKKVSKSLQRSIEQELKDRQQGGDERGLLMGGRIHRADLWHQDGTIFYRQKLPQDMPRLATSLLIDLSGSMSGTRIEHARKTAIILEDFCRNLNIPIAIYGHRSHGGDCRMEAYAEFDSRDNKDRYRLMSIDSGGCNRDGMALAYMAERLLVRDEEEKLLILISDGAPSASGYSGAEAMKDLSEKCAKYSRKGILFLAAGIGDDKEALRAIYKDAFFDISDLNLLPKKLTDTIKKHCV